MSEAAKDRLIRLGMTLASDTFINNYDRYPLIWDNDGNPENILVRVNARPESLDCLKTTKDLKNPENLEIDFGTFVALDNNPNLLDKSNRMAAPNIEAYHKRLDKFLTELLQELEMIFKEGKSCETNEPNEKFSYIKGRKETISALKGISTLIYNYTLYRLTPEDETYFLLGLIKGYSNIVRMGKKRIDILHESLSLPEKDDWCATWKMSYEKVNLGFLEDTLEVIQKRVDQFEEQISWADENILQKKYNIDFESEISSVLEDMKYLRQDKFNTDDIKVGEYFGREIELFREKQREEDRKRNEELKIKIKQKIREHNTQKVEKIKNMLERKF